MHYSLVLFLSFFLVACGGGGGGSSSGDVTVIQPSNPGGEGGGETINPMAAALASGNVADMPADTNLAYNEVIRIADEYETSYKTDLETFYGNLSINYPITNWSQFVSIEGWASEFNNPLVIGNGGRIHATYGEISDQRNAAFGTNIFDRARTGEELESYSPTLVNLVSWLIRSDLSDANNRVSIKVANVTTGQFNGIRDWFAAQTADVTITHCNDETAINSCVDASTDLLVVASNASPSEADALVNTALPAAAAQDVAVIYTHVHTWNTSAYTDPILEFLGYYMQSPGSPGNFFVGDQDRHAVWTNYTEMFDEQVAISSLNLVARDLVARLRDGSFSYDLPNCSESDCDNDARYAAELAEPLALIRNQFNLLDSTNTNIFSSDNNTMLKLMALLGDRLRAGVSLPMAKETANINDWSRAMVADFTVYNSRLVNPVQADLGNFSRTDFSHITPGNVNISLTSKPYFRATGVYALPGQTVRVTRTDNNNALATEVFVNAIRSGSSKPFTDREFERPKYLQSTSMPIGTRETVTFTSPYGGPVYIRFDALDVEAQFSFENVGQHPYWNGVEDNTRFAQAMNDNDYDWVVVASEHVEVHSRFDLMQTTLSDPLMSNAEDLTRLMQTFTHGDVFALAGFTGPDIQVTAEVQNFSTARGIPLTNRDRVQHGIMDQSTCGYGCSGNPYDAYWNFSPLGHGDLHEIGHTIEDGKFKFDGRAGHATTNPYSYYTKHRAWVEEAIEPNCQSVSFDEIHTLLQTAQGEADPDAFMAAQDMNDWNKGIALMIQVLMSAQNEGALTDGWQLYPMLHILEREYDRLRSNDADWNAGRATVGFSTYDRAELDGISNNDFLLVTMSFILGYNLQDYLEMFGLTFTAKASAQVTAGGFPAMPRNYFLPANNADFCKTLAQPVVAF
ncbi:ImpA family metalloprotease [Litoribacillus peritrichatus]|uniref:ImpA family metalloprotease n=1 Tax=Litoribacillus peritrichatus TaxID=718191 RepID=A0ABP7MRB0_9GAMM